MFILFEYCRHFAFDTSGLFIYLTVYLDPVSYFENKFCTHVTHVILLVVFLSTR